MAKIIDHPGQERPQTQPAALLHHHLTELDHRLIRLEALLWPHSEMCRTYAETWGDWERVKPEGAIMDRLYAMADTIQNVLGEAYGEFRQVNSAATVLVPPDTGRPC